MKITFLGTGTSQGVPVIACPCDVCQSEDPKDKRLRTSVIVETQGIRLVIDTGPDFRQQMLREQVPSLDAVVFTHEHKDHIAGLDDIRAFNFLQDAPMDIYCTERVEEALKREFHYVFAEEKYPGIPKMNLHRIDNQPFSIKGVEIIPIQVYHYRLPVLGFRIGDFTYITDANLIPDEEKVKIKGSKILVLNALRKEKHISHYTLSEAISVMEELSPEAGYFTHISHLMGKQAEVAQELPDFIELAYDGLTLEL